jgi:hypothetical protein
VKQLEAELDRMVRAFHRRLLVDGAVALAGAAVIPFYSDLSLWLSIPLGALCGLSFAETLTPRLEAIWRGDAHRG